MAKTITTQKQLQDLLRNDYARITLEVYRANNLGGEPAPPESTGTAQLNYINSLRRATGEQPFVMYVEVDTDGKTRVFEDIKRSLVSEPK